MFFFWEAVRLSFRRPLQCLQPTNLPRFRVWLQRHLRWLLLLEAKECQNYSDASAFFLRERKAGKWVVGSARVIQFAVHLSASKSTDYDVRHPHLKTLARFGRRTWRPSDSPNWPSRLRSGCRLAAQSKCGRKKERNPGRRHSLWKAALTATYSQMTPVGRSLSKWERARDGRISTGPPAARSTTVYAQITFTLLVPSIYSRSALAKVSLSTHHGALFWQKFVSTAVRWRKTKVKRFCMR